ncbi:hypothetical protein B0J18DRAFT_414365 [Chaetomium sp. MPI-SDFR-AT-0129]|nr:hypothetical protein B0J18DRAFT_414365 [Chaetomium sp. MPI-SDFR-AT-0129]
MAPGQHQNTFTVVPNPLGMQGLMSRPAGAGLAAAATAPHSRPPMTSKQVQKAYRERTRGPKLTKAEQRRIELEEQARIRKELERDKQLNRARVLRERKKEKEAKVLEERKKRGLPLVKVSASQDTIARFVRGNGVGRKRDAGGERVTGGVKKGEVGKENIPPGEEGGEKKRVWLDTVSEKSEEIQGEERGERKRMRLDEAVEFKSGEEVQGKEVEEKEDSVKTDSRSTTPGKAKVESTRLAHQEPIDSSSAKPNDRTDISPTEGKVQAIETDATTTSIPKPTPAQQAPVPAQVQPKGHETVPVPAPAPARRSPEAAEQATEKALQETSAANRLRPDSPRVEVQVAKPSSAVTVDTTARRAARETEQPIPPVPVNRPTPTNSSALKPGPRAIPPVRQGTAAQEARRHNQTTPKPIPASVQRRPPLNQVQTPGPRDITPGPQRSHSASSAVLREITNRPNQTRPMSAGAGVQKSRPHQASPSISHRRTSTVATFKQPRPEAPARVQPQNPPKPQFLPPHLRQASDKPATSAPAPAPAQPELRTLHDDIPNGLPTSTQLFVMSHLDELFPSPTQEARELGIERVAPAKQKPLQPGPTRREAKQETVNREPVQPRQPPRPVAQANRSMAPPPRPPAKPARPAAMGPPLKVPPVKPTASRQFRAAVTSRRPAPPKPADALDVPFIATQDLMFSTQDLRELEEPTPSKGARNAGHNPPRFKQPSTGSVSGPGTVSSQHLASQFQRKPTFARKQAVTPAAPTSDHVQGPTPGHRTHGKENRPPQLQQKQQQTEPRDRIGQIKQARPENKPMSPILNPGKAIQQENQPPHQQQQRPQPEQPPQINPPKPTPASNNPPTKPPSPPPEKPRFFTSSGLGVDTLLAMGRSRRTHEEEKRRRQGRGLPGGLSGGVNRDNTNGSHNSSNTRSSSNSGGRSNNSVNNARSSNTHRATNQGTNRATNRATQGAAGRTANDTVDQAADQTLSWAEKQAASLQMASQETDYGDLELDAMDFDSLVGVGAGIGVGR